MMTLHLARAIWKKFKPMFSTCRPLTGAKRGRPRINERKAFIGICYLVWSGCSWRALPNKYGKRSTVHRYFKKWSDSGLFQKLWHTVLVFLNQRGKLKNDVHVVDSSSIMVQHLPKEIAFVSAKLRPKRAIKFSLLVDAQGIPLATAIGSANEHDTNLLESTINQEVINQLNFGRRFLLADKGYIGPRQKNKAILNGYHPIFCPRNYHYETISKKERKLLNSKRWIVERSISWIKSLRRIKCCYERSLINYLSLLDLACLLISFKKGLL